MERKNQIEIRIAQIEEILSKAKIIDETKKSSTIGYGSKVTFEDDKGKVWDVTIVGTSEVDVDGDNLSFSLESPLGKALAGKKEGDTVVVKAPKGKYKIKVLKVA
jgi:transcription elongation factor GreA